MEFDIACLKHFVSLFRLKSYTGVEQVGAI